MTATDTREFTPEAAAAVKAAVYARPDVAPLAAERDAALAAHDAAGGYGAVSMAACEARRRLHQAQHVLRETLRPAYQEELVRLGWIEEDAHGH